MAGTDVRQLWRTRWWVRLSAVAVPVAISPFMLYPPWNPNPEYRRSGMPAEEWFWSVVILGCLGLAAWAAFHARVELHAGRVRVVNPVRSYGSPCPLW